MPPRVAAIALALLLAACTAGASGTSPSTTAVASVPTPTIDLVPLPDPPIAEAEDFEVGSLTLWVADDDLFLAIARPRPDRFYALVLDQVPLGDEACPDDLVEGSGQRITWDHDVVFDCADRRVYARYDRLGRPSSDNIPEAAKQLDGFRLALDEVGMLTFNGGIGLDAMREAWTGSPGPSGRPRVDPASFDPHNIVTPGFVPHAVLFFDDTTGIIGGRIGCPKRCEGDHDGILAVTNDAGSTWEVTARTGYPITHLGSVPTSGTVWATASRCMYFLDDCGRRLLRSTDGGMTWARRTSWVVNPAFATPSLGFGSGNAIRDGLTMQSSAITRDGGRTWAVQRGPCRDETNMTVAFSFPSPRRGWVACASREPGAGFFQFKQVLRTVDGGERWAAVSRHGLWANGGLLGMHMFADGSGYLWAGGGFAYLVHTVDGGRHWQTVWEDDGGGGQELTDISWLDPTNGFAVAWDSAFGRTLARTTDGGSHWKTLARWPLKV
jgi:photosystem II stability/assembly factor-like uncharacterized protein